MQAITGWSTSLRAEVRGDGTVTLSKASPPGNHMSPISPTWPGCSRERIASNPGLTADHQRPGLPVGFAAGCRDGCNPAQRGKRCLGADAGPCVRRLSAQFPSSTGIARRFPGDGRTAGHDCSAARRHLNANALFQLGWAMPTHRLKPGNRAIALEPGDGN
jgi:hypothetical protein